MTARLIKKGAFQKVDNGARHKAIVAQAILREAIATSMGMWYVILAGGKVTRIYGNLRNGIVFPVNPNLPAFQLNVTAFRLGAQAKMAAEKKYGRINNA